MRLGQEIQALSWGPFRGPVMNLAEGVERVKCPPLRVVAAAVRDRCGNVLIAQRPNGKHMAGRWEFPGGKIGEQESERMALERELREELGIEVLAARRSLERTFDYPDRRVRLAFWIVDDYRGRPEPRDAQVLSWVPIGELGRHDVLEADRPFIELLQTL